MTTAYPEAGKYKYACENIYIYTYEGDPPQVYMKPTDTRYDKGVVVVLRVGDAWLVGVGKRAPHGFRCPCLVSPLHELAR